MKGVLIFILSAIVILILLRMDFVRSTIGKLGLKKAYKTYNCLTDSIASENYVIQKIMDQSLDSFDQYNDMLYDTITNHFFIKTDEQVTNDYTLWKINNEGQLIDSIKAHRRLFKSGLLFYEKGYIDWASTGDKSIKPYDSIIDYDALSKEEFTRLLNQSTVVDFEIDYLNPDQKLGRCFVQIQQKWMVIESEKMFEDLDRDYTFDNFQIAPKNVAVKMNHRLIPLYDRIAPQYDWNNSSQLIFLQEFVPKKYESTSYFNWHNTTRSGWRGTGYFQLEYKEEKFNFKAFGFQHTSFWGYVSDGSFNPDLSIYYTDIDKKMDLFFINAGDLAQFKGRNPNEVGLYVLKRK